MEGIIPAIIKRRSIRGYKDIPIEEEKILRLLEAARLAPSAKNFQEWRFVVVRDRNTREELARAARDQMFIAGAPVVIVLCAVNRGYKMACGHPAFLIDLAIAGEHICLQAAEEGLGTCWIGAFYQDRVKKILGIPDDVSVVALIPVGYPDAPPREFSRKPLEEIVSYERWSF
ncbi:nitroreductase family protein [bacterium]|nr:nitroreductase family protein [bacterium]